MRVKLEISYIGDEYNGWQVQPNKKTVQGEIASAIKSLTSQSVILTGSGRTDTGVHALCQVAHFDLEKDFPIQKIKNGLNFYLPPSIRILSACEQPDFHARFDAKSKTYCYLFSTSDNALYQNRAYYKADLNYKKMEEASKVFLGKHDFSAFMSLGSEVKTTERKIFDIGFEKKDDFWVFSVTADGFLYNMVRKIVGTLIKVGESKLSFQDLKEILQKKDNTLSPIAPAYALYLKKVEY